MNQKHTPERQSFFTKDNPTLILYNRGSNLSPQIIIFSYDNRNRTHFCRNIPFKSYSPELVDTLYEELEAESSRESLTSGVLKRILEPHIDPSKINLNKLIRSAQLHKSLA